MSTSQAMVDAFVTVLQNLSENHAVDPLTKAYLFPDGVSEIDFECKVSPAQLIEMSIKVRAAKP